MSNGFFVSPCLGSFPSENKPSLRWGREVGRGLARQFFQAELLATKPWNDGECMGDPPVAGWFRWEKAEKPIINVNV